MRNTFDIVYRKSDLLWTIPRLPMRIRAGKTTRAKLVFVHLNAYNNLFGRMAQNALKKFYSNYVRLPPKPDKPYAGRVKTLFVYYRPDRRKRDLHNMATIVCKFVLDVLVDEEYMEDDNIDYIQDVHFAYGGIDPSRTSGEIDLYIFKEDKYVHHK